MHANGEEIKLVGPSNITSLFVNNIPCQALLDSGSQVCTITDAFYQTLPNVGLPEPVKLSISGADGNTIPHLGMVFISLHFLDQEFRRVPTLVVPTTSYRNQVPLLIGTNVIRATKTIFQQSHGADFLQVLRDQSPRWHAACSQLLADGDTITMEDGHAVYLGPESVTLQPGEDVVLTAHVSVDEDYSENHTVLVDSTSFTDTPGGIGKASLLTHVTDGTVPVRVCNLRAKPVQIHKNMRLASVSVVAEGDIQNIASPTTKPDSSGDAGDTVQIHQTQTNNCSSMPPVDLTHLNDLDISDIHKIEEVLKRNSDVFSIHDMDFGHTATIKHDIPLVDPIPFRLPHRRIPPPHYQEVREHLQKMQTAGAIRPSKSPYASQIVLVRKKDGSLRICIDYRQLNLRTVRDAFPLPRIEEALDSLAHAKFFTSLDLTSGYWQVEVAEEDKPKTAFSTPMGLFECNRMPFGLQNAPATFQRLMMTCLGDLNLSSLLIYLDDNHFLIYH